MIFFENSMSVLNGIKYLSIIPSLRKIWCMHSSVTEKSLSVGCTISFYESYLSQTFKLFQIAISCETIKQNVWSLNEFGD